MMSSNQYDTAVEMLSKSGELLLESGMFADIKITCGDRTWDLHKTIICPRCPYFRRAFTGRFQEAKTGELVLHDQTPKEVDWVIKFLYSGKVPDEFTKVQSTRSCVNLYKIADYFAVPSLGHQAILLLRCELTTLANKIQEAGDAFPNNPSNTLSDEDINDYFYAAKTAYESGSSSLAALRGVITTFLAQTRFVVGKDARFVTNLEQVPGLAIDMVKLMVESNSRGGTSPAFGNNPAAERHIIQPTSVSGTTQKPGHHRRS